MELLIHVYPPQRSSREASSQENKAEHQKALQSSEARHNLNLWLEAEAGQIKLKITRVFIRVSLITGIHQGQGGRVGSLAPKVFTSRWMPFWR